LQGVYYSIFPYLVFQRAPPDTVTAAKTLPCFCCCLIQCFCWPSGPGFRFFCMLAQSLCALLTSCRGPPDANVIDPFQDHCVVFFGFPLPSFFVSLIALELTPSFSRADAGALRPDRFHRQRFSYLCSSSGFKLPCAFSFSLFPSSPFCPFPDLFPFPLHPTFREQTPRVGGQDSLPRATSQQSRCFQLPPRF